MAVPYFNRLVKACCVVCWALSVFVPSTVTYAQSVNISISGPSDPSLSILLPQYSMSYARDKHNVVFKRNDGKGQVLMRIMPPNPYTSTTKEFAQSVMDSYSGWGLKAQIARRGFSFNYVDNGPCVALVSYFDGATYLFVSACGEVSKEDISRALAIGRRKLSLDAILYKSSMPAQRY